MMYPSPQRGYNGQAPPPNIPPQTTSQTNRLVSNPYYGPPTQTHSGNAYSNPQQYAHSHPQYPQPGPPQQIIPFQTSPILPQPPPPRPPQPQYQKPYPPQYQSQPNYQYQQLPQQPSPYHQAPPQQPPPYQQPPQYPPPYQQPVPPQQPQVQYPQQQQQQSSGQPQPQYYPQVYVPPPLSYLEGTFGDLLGVNPKDFSSLQSYFSKAAGIDDRIDRNEFALVYTQMHPNSTQNPNFNQLADNVFRDIDVNQTNYLNFNDFIAAYGELKRRMNQ